MMIKITLEELNNIIQEAINHGGDYGGPYYCNKEDFEKSLSNVCELNNLVIVNDEHGYFDELKLARKLQDITEKSWNY